MYTVHASTTVTVIPIPESANIPACIQALDLKAIVTHHWQIVPCSAITGERLLDGVNWVTADISSRVFTMD